MRVCYFISAGFLFLFGMAITEALMYDLVPAASAAAARGPLPTALWPHRYNVDICTMIYNLLLLWYCFNFIRSYTSLLLSQCSLSQNKLYQLQVPVYLPTSKKGGGTMFGRLYFLLIKLFTSYTYHILYNVNSIFLYIFHNVIFLFAYDLNLFNNN